MKRILVHLDASPRTTVRLALAQRLAHRDGAELDAFYGVEPTLVALPWAAAEGLARCSSGTGRTGRRTAQTRAHLGRAGGRTAAR
jgi:nucleotide-binding universal stress UspA family protein